MQGAWGGSLPDYWGPCGCCHKMLSTPYLAIWGWKERLLPSGVASQEAKLMLVE